MEFNRALKHAFRSPQAELLVELHRELEVTHCRLVTISTDNITETIHRSRKPVAATCRRPKCTSSMEGISRSIPQWIRSRSSSGTS
jgi:hypothetical protein